MLLGVGRGDSLDDAERLAGKIARLRLFDIHVETGVFGARMAVELVNDGPVTIIVDP
jgi:D-Tyr-tRNAtyr deacylase